MNARDHILQLTAVFGAALAGLAFLIGGAGTGVGALCGSVVALLNAVAIRFIARHVTQGSFQQRTGVMGLLGIKMMVLAAAFYGLASRGVDPVGLAIGYGALVLAVLVGSSMATPSPSSIAPEET